MAPTVEYAFLREGLVSSSETVAQEHQEAVEAGEMARLVKVLSNTESPEFVSLAP